MLTNMGSLLEQIKQRRLALCLKQNDMMLRVGVSRQQYQRLESKGNPRLDTIALIAKGLHSELVLVPKEKLNAVLAVLEQEDSASNQTHAVTSTKTEANKNLSDNPWQGLLGDEV